MILFGKALTLHSGRETTFQTNIGVANIYEFLKVIEKKGYLEKKSNLKQLLIKLGLSATLIYKNKRLKSS